jgi:hypothetical protein
MNRVLLVKLRHYWQLSAAAAVFLLFMASHVLIFEPAARRMRTVLERAEKLGFALDPNRVPRMMPPRVLALLSNNAMTAQVAKERVDSGVLTAALLEEVTRVATRCGMKITATDPGASTQQPRAVLVRARLRMRCSFGEFVSFLDELSRSGVLISVERFMLVGDSPGDHELEVSVARYVLKQDAGRT